MNPSHAGHDVRSGTSTRSRSGHARADLLAIPHLPHAAPSARTAYQTASFAHLGFFQLGHTLVHVETGGQLDIAGAAADRRLRAAARSNFRRVARPILGKLVFCLSLVPHARREALVVGKTEVRCGVTDLGGVELRDCRARAGKGRGRNREGYGNEQEVAHVLSPQWRWASASDRGSQAPASLTGDRAWSGTRQPAKSARADRSRPWLGEIQSNAAHLVH